MKRLYVTFGGASYDNTTQHIVEQAPKLGADEVRVYDDSWLLQTDFYDHNKWLWLTKDMRGFGWFCWKPYVIMHALENYCQPGDIVLYTDADTYPIADFSILYDECARIGGCMLFAAQGCSNRHWVKGDCWRVMAAGLQVYERRDVPVDSQHATARFMLFQAGEWKPRQLLMEWLTYCVNPLATTFDPSILCGDSFEPREFQQHRTEQAILSLLAHKYGYKLYREACQFGDAAQEDRDLYPTLFHQDGTRVEAGLEGSRYRNV